MKRKCVSHHFACDCREEYFAKMQSAIDMWADHIKHAHPSYFKQTYIADLYEMRSKNKENEE